MELFRAGGFMMWPLLLIGLGIVIVTARAGKRARSEVPEAKVERDLLSILFWGTMALLLGVLGTVVGLIQIGQAISVVQTISPTTVIVGLSVTMITLLFGLLLFILAMSCWYGVRRFAERRGFA